jgi:hypothetical protein
VTERADAPRIAQVMADLARAMQQPGDAALTLPALTACATDSIEGADYASIFVRHRDGRLETLAPTDPIVRRVDLLQFELSGGPCHDAVEATSYAFRRPGSRRTLAGVRDTGGRARTRVADGYPPGERRRLASRPEPARPSPGCLRQRDDLVAEVFADQAAAAKGFVRTVQTVNMALLMRETIGQAAAS